MKFMKLLVLTVIFIGFVSAQSISISPNSPAVYTIGGSPVGITLVSSPSGGSFTFSEVKTNQTGGRFIRTSSLGSTVTGRFNNATQVGSASVNITYTHPTSGSVTETFVVFVTKQNSLNLFPSNAVIGLADSVTFAAAVNPVGGSFTQVENLGSTNGTFTTVSSGNPRVIRFNSNSFNTGTATLQLTYTAPTGFSYTETFSVTVVGNAIATLQVNPESPIVSLVPGFGSSFVAEDIVISMLGSPPGGSFSFDINDSGTDGQFAVLNGGNPFTARYFGATTPGFTDVRVIYTAPSGATAVEDIVILVESTDAADFLSVVESEIRSKTTMDSIPLEVNDVNFIFRNNETDLITDLPTPGGN